MPSVHHTNYITVPVEYSCTNLIPDMCILFKDTQQLIILELYVPFEKPLIKSTHMRKTNTNHCVMILAQMDLM